MGRWSLGVGTGFGMVVYTQEAVKMKNNIRWVMNTRVYTHSVKFQKSKGHTLSDPYKSPRLPPGLINLILADIKTTHSLTFRLIYKAWMSQGGV